MNKLLELVQDQNGTLSHTKLWSNIGLFLISVTYCYQVYIHELTPELMLTFGGIVVTGRAASKYLDTKGNTTIVSIDPSSIN